MISLARGWREREREKPSSSTKIPVSGPCACPALQVIVGTLLTLLGKPLFALCGSVHALLGAGACVYYIAFAKVGGVAVLIVQKHTGLGGLGLVAFWAEGEGVSPACTQLLEACCRAPAGGQRRHTSRLLWRQSHAPTWQPARQRRLLTVCPEKGVD